MYHSYWNSCIPDSSRYDLHDFTQLLRKKDRKKESKKKDWKEKEVK